MLSEKKLHLSRFYVMLTLCKSYSTVQKLDICSLALQEDMIWLLRHSRAEFHIIGYNITSIVWNFPGALCNTNCIIENLNSPWCEEKAGSWQSMSSILTCQELQFVPNVENISASPNESMYSSNIGMGYEWVQWQHLTCSNQHNAEQPVLH